MRDQMTRLRREIRPAQLSLPATATECQRLKARKSFLLLRLPRVCFVTITVLQYIVTHSNIYTTEDSEVKDLPEDEKPVEAATENGTKDTADTVAEPDATPASANKSKSRRKSSGVPEHKGRKLNKKESKAKMSNIHAQPGEYYFIKLRGFPKWPGIIASEDMLPDAILKTRPVTAAKPDGTYREDFAEGGKNMLDRTFPVMFFETNEL